jgi:hypothetical protein
MGPPPAAVGHTYTATRKPHDATMARRSIRDFAGQKSAPLFDVFAAWSAGMSRVPMGAAETKGKYDDVIEAILDECSARCVFDLGGLWCMTKEKFKQILVAAAAPDPDAWMLGLENALDFSFQTEFSRSLTADLPSINAVKAGKQKQSKGAGADQQGANMLVKGKRQQYVSKFVNPDEDGLGAELLAAGTLANDVLTYDMFPKLETANPACEEITNTDFSHTLDVLFQFVFSKHGRVNLDKIYRDHLASEHRRLFPLLPVWGKTAGKDRDRARSIKFRFQYWRSEKVQVCVPSGTRFPHRPFLSIYSPPF